MSNPLTTNPLANISYTGAEKLSINPDDLNFQKGTVATAGGILKAYETTQEANKLATFNNAMLDMQQRGDVEGLKQLTSYSDQFKDATVKQKAYSSALTAFDTTATTKILTDAEKAKQDGDLNTFKSILTSLPSTNISPESKAKIQTKLGEVLPVLTGNSLFKDALTTHDTEFSKVNSGNITAFNDAFNTNPEYSKYFVNSNGRLIPTLIDPNSPTATADIAKQAELEKQFYSTAAGKGAKALIGDVDTGITNLRKQLRASNVPEDQIAKLTQSFASEAMQRSQLGPQLKAKEAELHAAIDAKAGNDLARLDSRYNLTKKFTETEMADASKAVTFKQDDLYEHINKNFDNTTWYSTADGRNEIKAKLQEVLSTKLPTATGTRVPEPYEVKQALDILSTNPLFRDARVADMDQIKTALSGVMKEQVVGKADALKIPLAEIDTYYKNKQQVQSGTTAEKLRVTGRLLSGMGISDTASILTAEPAKTGAINTPVASSSTSTPVDPVNATNSAAQAEANLIAAKANQPAIDSNAQTLSPKGKEALNVLNTPAFQGNDIPAARIENVTKALIKSGTPEDRVLANNLLETIDAEGKVNTEKYNSVISKYKNNSVSVNPITRISPQVVKGKILAAANSETTSTAEKKNDTLKSTSASEISPQRIDTLFSNLTQAESKNKHTTKDGKLTVSDKGALGITQVMPKTGEDPGYGVEPIKNDSKEEYLRFGKDYLKAMIKEFDGNEELGVAAYNAGVKTIKDAIKSSVGSGKDWKEHLPKPQETIPYMDKILGTDYKTKYASAIVKKQLRAS